VSFRKFNKKGRLEETLSTFPSPQTQSARQALPAGFPTFSISLTQSTGTLDCQAQPEHVLRNYDYEGRVMYEDY
jgi:hypothetical protein